MSKSRRETVCAIRSCCDGNKIWFVHAFLNILYSYNLETKKLRGYTFGKNVKNTIYCFSDIRFYNDKIYLIPGKGRKIVVFDSRTEKFQMFDLPVFGLNDGQLFAIDSMVLNDTLLTFPYTDTIIRRFDLSSYEWINHIDLNQFIDSKWRGGNLFVQKGTSSGILTRNFSSNFLLFDYAGSDPRILKTNLPASDEISLTYINGRLFAFLNNYSGIIDDNIYEVNISTGEIINKRSIGGKNKGFTKLFGINNRYIAVENTTFLGNVIMSLELDIISDTRTSIYDIQKSDFSYRFSMGMPTGIWVTDNNNSYRISNTSNSIDIYKDYRKTGEYKFEFNIGEYDRLFYDYTKDYLFGETIYEQVEYGLSLFLEDFNNIVKGD